MAEQDGPALADTSEATKGEIEFFVTRDGFVITPPPDRLIMRDETGQPWVVTMSTDGSLLTKRLDESENLCI